MVCFTVEARAGFAMATVAKRDRASFVRRERMAASSCAASMCACCAFTSASACWLAWASSCCWSAARRCSRSMASSSSCDVDMLATLFTSSSVLCESWELLFRSWAAFMSNGVNHLLTGCGDASSCVELDWSFFGVNSSCWNFFNKA